MPGTEVPGDTVVDVDGGVTVVELPTSDRTVVGVFDGTTTVEGAEPCLPFDFGLVVVVVVLRLVLAEFWGAGEGVVPSGEVQPVGGLPIRSGPA